MQIEYSKKFIKEFKKSPEIVKKSLKDKLNIFIVDKYDPRLNNHPLSGKLNRYRSININNDWRAIFEELNKGEIIYFIAIGTHSQLYS